MVNEMLCELPNTDSVLKRFNDIEEHLGQCQVDLSCYSTNQCHSNTDAQFENPSMSMMSEYNIAAVSNEIHERRKKEKSFVIHNLPETTNVDEDIDLVKDIIEEITGTEASNTLDYNVFTSKPRVSRLGRKVIGRTRTIKIHVKSAEVCESILSSARKLTSSEKFSTVVLQHDLTALQQKQLKDL